MRQAKWWRSMVAWVLVGVLMVGLWATPGWAKKPKEEKLSSDRWGDCGVAGGDRGGLGLERSEGAEKDVIR